MYFVIGNLNVLKLFSIGDKNHKLELVLPYKIYRVYLLFYRNKIRYFLRFILLG